MRGPRAAKRPAKCAAAEKTGQETAVAGLGISRVDNQKDWIISNQEEAKGTSLRGRVSFEALLAGNKTKKKFGGCARSSAS